MSVDNIAWFHQFMAEMRTSIEEGRFEAFREEVRRIYPPEPPEPPRKGRRREEDE